MLLIINSSYIIGIMKSIEQPGNKKPKKNGSQIELKSEIETIWSLNKMQLQEAYSQLLDRLSKINLTIDALNTQFKKAKTAQEQDEVFKEMEPLKFNERPQAEKELELVKKRLTDEFRVNL